MAERRVSKTSSLHKARRLPFTIARDAPTRKKIKQNSLESPLLRLPLEIREKIYEELLGARLLHIEDNHWQHAEYDVNRTTNSPDPEFCDQCRLTCVSCLRDADQGADDAVNGDDKSDYYYKYHEPCIKHLQPPTPLPIPFTDSTEPQLPWPTSRVKERIPNRRALDVTLLRCCRQLYNECNQVLLNRNVFSFNNPIVFSHFMQNIHTAQRGQLRSLQLHVSKHVSHLWSKASKLVVTLRGLRSLDLIASTTTLHVWAPDIMTDPLSLLENYEFLLRFRILPVKRVHVRIEDSGTPWVHSWTKADRLATAEVIKEKIYDVEGVKAHNEETKLLREMLQARKAEESEFRMHERKK